MGVWSSIRKSAPEQILSFDPDAFSQTLLKDVRKIKIQESLSQTDYCCFEISPPSTIENDERKVYSTNFEYSMGGNLKFYKEHFIKDYLMAKSCSKFHGSTTNYPALRDGSLPLEQGNRTTNKPTLGSLPRKQRNRSISDQDSDPEALRFSQKYQTQSTNEDVMEQSNTADLSFDHYSTIYQPEFLLNVPQRPHQNQVIGDIVEEHVVLKKTKHVEERTTVGNLGKEIFDKETRLVSESSEIKSGEKNEEKVDLKPVVAFSNMTQRKRSKVIKDTSNEKISQPVQSFTNEQGLEYLRQDNVPKAKANVKLGEATVKEIRRHNFQTYKKDEVPLAKTPKKITLKEWNQPDIGEYKEAWKVKTIVHLPNNLAKPFSKKQDSKEEPLSDGDRDYLQNKVAENIKKRYGVVQDISDSMKKVPSKNTNQIVSPKTNIKDCNVKLSLDKKYETLQMKQQNTKSAEYRKSQKLVGKKTLDREYPAKKNSKIAQKIVKTKIIDDKSKEEKNIISKNSLGSLSLKISLEENHGMSTSKSTTEDHRTDWFSPITITDTNDHLYPESPTAEISFYKTPCSTRHNSAGSLEDSDEDNVIGEFEEVLNPKQNENNQAKDDPVTEQDQLVESKYARLPKEFQEMARRLSKTGDLPRSKIRPSLHQVLPSNSNCSSSTTSSPRSPSARTLSRTPSYKMPKTPSLSRQHPATYVTQHTSSRSKPSSRVSSRAPSPTRDYNSDGWLL